MMTPMMSKTNDQTQCVATDLKLLPPIIFSFHVRPVHFYEELYRWSKRTVCYSRRY